MSKYFDGYASFDYKEMSKEKLISELKEKVRYIGELKRSYNDEIAKMQSAKDKQISELEAKLAEKELEAIRWEEHFNNAKMDYECLKEKLAEKEKEIEKQNRRISLLEKYKNDQKTRANDYYKQCKQANQDKISFAVEHLKALKPLLLNSWVENDCNLFVEDAEKIIDNQIEELKKEIK